MITPDIILITVGIIALIAASIVDIKTREVPDTISYSMIIIGLTIKLIYAINTSQWTYLLNAVLITIILFGFGLIMYFSKQWGGGDVKLLAGIGALFSVHTITPLFSLDLIINVLITGSVYGIGWAIYLALKNKNKICKDKLTKPRLYFKIFLIIVLLILIGLVLLVQANPIILLIAILLLILELYLFIKPIEKICMYRYYPISKLTEGDWIAKAVKIKNKVLITPKNTGLTKKQIALLKKHKIKRVLVKEGIAFVPAIAIATILTLIFGNFILLIL